MTKDKRALNLRSILIAEDHELYGDGIELLMQELFPQANTLRAFDFDAAWQILSESNDIDLILMDLKMPGTTGINGVKAIKSQWPELVIVVLSSMDMGANVQSVMDVGVNAFISKSTSKTTMKAVFPSIIEGKRVSISPDSTTTKLSTRQKQTLKLMADGRTNKEIAKLLNLSPNTVKEYVSLILSTLGADNRVKAVQKARSMGLFFDD